MMAVPRPFLSALFAHSIGLIYPETAHKGPWLVTLCYRIEILPQ